MTRAAVLAAFVLAPSWAAAGERDVPFFLANPAERRAMAAWCAGSAARQDTAECRNAKAAGAADIITPGHKWGRGRAVAPRPVAPPPRSIGRGPARAA